MIDMSEVIVAKSDQINGPDLMDAPRTVTIAGVRKTGKEQAVEIRLEGEDKVWRPCKTTVRIMVAGWKADGAQWVGKQATLIYDPNVTFGKLKPGGIRISHMSHLNGNLVVCLQERRGSLKEFIIKPLAQRPATNTRPPATTPPPVSDGGSTSSAGAGAAPTGELPTTAQEWIAETMRQIAACETIADLAELQAGKTKGLARLEAFPKAHADVVALFNDRRGVIEGGVA